MVGTLSVLLIFIHYLTLSASQPDFVHYKCDNSYGNYTSNSTYQDNLKTLLSDVSSNTQITYGFYNFSGGKGPDEVKGVALCKGDVPVADCRSCLNDATNKLVEVCPMQKQAIGWYNDCMLRYTNRSIFGVMEAAPLYGKMNKFKALDANDFDRVLSDVLLSLMSKTASGNSTLKFAMGQANVSTFSTIYAYTQCTPDLSQSDCTSCLSETIGKLRDCCLPYQGLRFFRPSCFIRYELYKFSDESFPPITFTTSTSSSVKSPPPPGPPLRTTASTSSSPPSAASGKGRDKSKIVIIVAVIVASFILILVICCCFNQRRKGWTKPNSEFNRDDQISAVQSLQFAFVSIKTATENFAEANKLGRGGFGAVYKGKLANGQEIAVKRLAQNSGQGDLEFKNEVQLVAKLEHRNLVRLLGFSLERDERLLIYEFVPNASLDHFLFDATKRVYLDWHTRHKIIVGIARGLLYLHEDSRLRIVHRDLKASNILLDHELNPKIADFGLARLFQAEETHADTIRIAGTYGYMAPEYALHGFLSVKSDVYSFGVLVLEIVSGQKIFGSRNGEDDDGLVTSVWRNLQEGKAFDVVDSTLAAGSRTEIMRCIHVGLLCVQEDLTQRPTMSSVLLMLSNESLTLPTPSRPAYVFNKSLVSDPQECHLRGSIELTAEEESITELHPR